MQEVDRPQEMFDVGIARGQTVKFQKPNDVLNTGWSNSQVEVRTEICPGPDAGDDVLG